MLPLVGPDGSQFPWIEFAVVLVAVLICWTTIRLVSDYLERRRGKRR